MFFRSTFVLTTYVSFLFFSIGACTFSTCSFVVFASAAVAHEIIVILIKSISYFMDIMHKHIYLNFGVISFINKEMVTLNQLHTYKFGLVYLSVEEQKFKNNAQIINFQFKEHD